MVSLLVSAVGVAVSPAARSVVTVSRVWPVAAGNDQMIEALNLIQDHLFVGIFPALQEAGIAALLDPKSEEAVAQLNATYDSRRDAFVQAAAKIGLKAFPSKGSFYEIGRAHV